MKAISTTALIAVIATTLSLGGAMTASAQSTTPAPDSAAPAQAAPSTTPQKNTAGHHRAHHRNWGPRGGMGGPAMAHWGQGMRGQLMGLVCSPRGKERLDIAFLRLSYRLHLTDDQQSAFDDLRSTALDEQAKFAETCQSAMPRRTAGEKPDAVAAMKARIAVGTARLAALNAVLPKFEALYSSLTDQQKAALMPARRGPMGQRSGMGGMHRFGPMGPGHHMQRWGHMGPHGAMGHGGRSWNRPAAPDAATPAQPDDTGSGQSST